MRARVLRSEQPRRAGLDQDHVDRVAGGVVEVARNARALLRCSETSLALGLPLRAERALLEFGDPLTPLANAVPDDPCATPDEGSEEQRHRRKLAVGGADGAGVNDEHRRDDGAGEPPGTPCLLGAQSEEEDGDRGAERRAGRIVERVQHGARRGGHHEDRERRPAPRDERQ